MSETTIPTQELIFEAMEKRGWTRDDLAARADMPRAILDNILGGRRAIDVPIARALVRAFSEGSVDAWVRHYQNYRHELAAGKRPA